MKLPPINPAVKLLEDFRKRYNERDLEGLLGLFCVDHRVHCWGTGVDENRHGVDGMREQVLRDWSQSEKSLITSATEIYSSADPSWATGDFSAQITVGGETISVSHLRASIYVVQEKGEWKISHMHSSFPERSQPEGSSFPTRA